MQLNPHALNSRQVGIDEVSNAINAGNVNLPTGILWGTNRTATVQANGQLGNAKDFGDLVVAWRNGSPVRVRDLGEVIDDVQNNRVASWVHGDRAIVLAVQRQPGTNTVQVANRVRRPARPPEAPAARVGRGQQALRPLGLDPQLGQGRAVHAAAYLRARRAGDLPVPQESTGDHHSQPRAAALGDRHVRRRCSAWATTSTTSR